MNFVKVDAKQLYNEILVQFQQALGEVLYPGDERRIFLEQEVQLIVGIYNAINESAKQNLLTYAKGQVLDAIGIEYDTKRLQAQKAMCRVEFRLSSAQMQTVHIPKGTRVTPDGLLFFETLSDTFISANTTSLEVDVVATVAGVNHNGFAPGQIKTLVDMIPFVGSVSNITTSSGGSQEEEDDNGVDIWSGYRERIRLAAAKISTAGHELGYIYHAKSADTDIDDVIVTSPRPGEILITALMKNGQLPSETIIERIKESCNSKKARPMTDKVSVAAPTVSEYSISLTYYIALDDAASENIIKAKVVESVNEYIKWQDSKIGRSVNPDYLKQLILNAGAYKVDITSPIYTEIQETQVPKVTTKSIIYGGLKG
ncbi:baseplate J/gp47 family protein [Niameybacter massiliensis]|uniref:Baseplate J/gp47 family protein n=1 Tax=Holtiella tumoricola TaxID=3018743 RepID=A0AA42J1H4_9FIRM|nr:baseplate J/gp47 family protein [Holtiella tumoricola]MDA3732395.1 baseplate J/gp47 family protein [Holtiella tumoricola]